MKKTLALLACLITFSLQGQTTTPAYPSYDEVITRFFAKYDIQNYINPEFVQFEKRPTGWHVVVVEKGNNEHVVKNELFWDRAKNTFNPIHFNKKIGAVNSLNEYKGSPSKLYFQLSPYYGYLGWELDVIQEYENMENPSDSILCGLGYAYSNFASGLLNNNNGLSSLKYRFELPDGKNSLTEEQLTKYRYYSHKGIDAFKRLREKNPRFETIVGEAGLKLSNEYLTSFLDLRVYQNEEEAKKEITDGLYSDFYLAYARNMLSSCQPNAILFTYGDSDTFPLLYVQAQYGFRTDVLVVNVSLLQVDRYINSLREKILDAEPLPISFTPDQIKGSKREIIMLVERTSKYVELSDLIDFVKDDRNIFRAEAPNYFTMPSNKFQFREGETIMSWSLNRDYLYRSELIMLDALSLNNWKRPVYFTTQASLDSYSNLDKYLQLEGLVYRLTSTKKEVLPHITGYVGVPFLYDNLMHNYEIPIVANPSIDELFIYIVYRDKFVRLAESLLTDGKEKEARNVLDICIQKFPNEFVSYDMLMMSAIESYYRLGEFEKGNKIAKQLAYNLKNTLTLATKSIRKVSEDYSDYYLEELSKLLNKYNQHNIIGK